MYQSEFIKSEVKNYLKFLFPELNEEQLYKKFEETEYNFNEEHGKILINIKGLKQSIVMGWSDINGIYGLNDENRDFDEKYQEGEQ